MRETREATVPVRRSGEAATGARAAGNGTTVESIMLAGRLMFGRNGRNAPRLSVQARLAEESLELAPLGSRTIEHGLEPVMPPVRHLKSDQRHEIDERNSDDAAYQPRQHADRPPSRGLYRWQWTVP